LQQAERAQRTAAAGNAQVGAAGRQVPAHAEVPGAHGGKHRRSASCDEGGFERVLGPLSSVPGTPAQTHALDDIASLDLMTDDQLSGSDISADDASDDVSDDGSTSLEDMSDEQILASSPPLALPRPAPKPTGDPRLSLRLYKLVSRWTF